MTVRHFILATAGHIDHGKSSLVQKLTGTDPDRLPEEKSRGMTIDLGFASYLPKSTLSVGIVDVPGHEDFIKNMVAGVGAIDAALLVVAADDGWMQQTEEHLRILQYLNVRHGVVALSKSDRVAPENLAEAIDSIRRQLGGTFLATSPIVPTSIHGEAGLKELQTAIVTMFDGMAAPVDIGKPRVQIDRSFLIRGVGRIVTGTLSGGTLSNGQNITLAPAMAPSKIRGIQSHNQDRKTAVPGTRVALNLPDLPASAEWRGQTLTLQSLSTSHDVVDVLLQVSERDGSIYRIKRNISIHVHHGTQSVQARIIPFSDSSLAQLRLENPLTAFIGDRLILRDAAQRNTIAGAIVLDPAASRAGMRQPARLAFLSACAAGIDDVDAMTAAIISDRHIVQRTELLTQSHFSKAAIDAAIDRLKRSGNLFCFGESVIDSRCWETLLSLLASKIRAFHDANPEQIGMPLAMLRQAIEAEMKASDLLEPAIDALTTADFARVQSVIRHQDHKPMLPTRLKSAGERLRSALQTRRLDPPPRSELTPDAASQQVLAFLKTSGEVIELSPQVVISSNAFSEAVRCVREFLSKKEFATAAELKTAMGTSRRVAIPLLEKLDQTGITRREGDVRRLR